MRITKFGLIAGALLAVPAAGLAAGAGSPANGKFKGARTTRPAASKWPRS